MRAFYVFRDMVISEDIESFRKGLDGLSNNYKLLCNSLFKLKGDNVSKSMFKKGKEYLNNENLRMERIKTIYDEFSSQISEVCERFVNKIEVLCSEGMKEVKELENDVEEMRNKMKMKGDKLNTELYHDEEPSFVYRGWFKSTIDVGLVKEYPGSYFYREYNSDRRTEDGNIFIDIDGANDDLIIKYMKEDYCLLDDIKKMDYEKRSHLLNDLNYLKLPINQEFVKELGYNEDNEIMEAWKHKRIVTVNGKDVSDLLQSSHMFNSVIYNKYSKYIHYDKRTKKISIEVVLKYWDVIAEYLKNGQKFKKEFVKQNDYGDADELVNEMEEIGIELSDEEKKMIDDCFFHSSEMLSNSQIVDKKYDKYFQKWLGSDHKWKLIFRASEYDYSAKFFHQYCDDQGPTLVVIKSSEGWIFGGYTTQSWKVVHPNEYGGIF